MPLPMARPVKIKDSRNRQYVARIPRDVLDKARGQTVTVEIDGRPVPFRIGPTAQVVKFSLRTSDQTLARSRHRAVAERMSNWFDTLRTGSGRGIWQQIFETVAGSPEPPEQVALDSTHVKAHRCAGGGKGGRQNRRSVSPRAGGTASFMRLSISYADRG